MKTLRLFVHLLNTMSKTRGLLSCRFGQLKSFRGERLTAYRAVLDSRNNLANQEVFRIAKSADPDGRRTIGIMTKLDALQPGDEPAVSSCRPQKMKVNQCLPRRSRSRGMRPNLSNMDGTVSGIEVHRKSTRESLLHNATRTKRPSSTALLGLPLIGSVQASVI